MRFAISFLYTYSFRYEFLSSSHAVSNSVESGRGSSGLSRPCFCKYASGYRQSLLFARDTNVGRVNNRANRRSRAFSVGIVGIVVPQPFSLEHVIATLYQQDHCSRVPFSGWTLASSGGITTAAATLSSVSRLRSLTPEVLRPALRMVLVSMRMILPKWEMSIISVVSSTRLMAETLPILGVVFMEMTPLPPRDCRR